MMLPPPLEPPRTASSIILDVSPSWLILLYSYPGSGSENAHFVDVSNTVLQSGPVTGGRGWREEGLSQMLEAE